MPTNKFSTQSSNSKQLTAQDIYELTSAVLQEHFQLDMSGSQFEASDMWDVLVAAAVERVTIEGASKLLEDAPSPNTVRNAVKELLGNDEKLAELEATVNAMLVARLPKKLLRRTRPCAVDLTEIPYHGRHEEDDERIRRGRAKSGTTHFHCFATLFVIKKNKRYTLAVTLVKRSDLTLAVLKKLLKRGKKVGLRVRRLLLDREFDNNGVIAYLADQPFGTIIPLTIRGKKARALLKTRKSYRTTFTRSSEKYGAQTFDVQIVCKYSKGRYKRQGIRNFAYILIGTIKLTPQQIFEEYRHRFGIETSYRLMNTVRARTTSKCAALRLFFVALALLLLNLWSFVKWHFLFVPKPGPRQLLHSLLPLARWRLWLWEMIKLRQGFSLSIVIPISA
ncbi:MAG: ISH3 family transposase [Planctomycetaceae bacterium]|nr:ISH3 family transposase [Planctomycetaceae bacterium]